MFQVRGTEKREGGEKHVWFAYASSEASAEHLMKLFLRAGYDMVRVRDLENP